MVRRFRTASLARPERTLVASTSITPKVLTQRLRQLERDGLVARTYHAEVPPRVEYEITALGASLGPLFAHLATWADDNLPAVERARAAFDAR
jgi:DNA-binding HxlR family transcriptional regulator